MDVLSRLSASPLASAWGLLKELGERAWKRGESLYLVGGVVRDLLLGRPNFDLDLVVEGDALGLAKEVAGSQGGKVTLHPRFGTAKLKLGGWTLDLATARQESYPHPGALPRVRPGTIADDLRRRDFTINAVAVSLSPASLGELFDPYEGRKDIQTKLIRILHPNSFIDDATRILRALRYEQRLGFHLEENTESLLYHHLPWLNAISGDRLRHELELILEEEEPEKVLGRAGELGVLAYLHPSLKGNSWLTQKFIEARHRSLASTPLYLALLIYPLTPEENEAFIQRLHFPKSVAQILRHTLEVKKRLPQLCPPPSHLYHLLSSYSPIAITANAVAEPSACPYLELFLHRLRFVKPILRGNDLFVLGVGPGRQVGEILEKIRDARLDGKVRTRQDEVDLVKQLL